MGLFDMNKGGGLFGSFDPSTEDALGQYAAMPAQREKRGGVFGSGYDGEDIMSMLLRAAAIAQGDYGAGAEFGSNIGARAKAAAAEAQKRQAEREDYVWKQETDQRFAGPPKPPEIQQQIEYLRTQPGMEKLTVAEALDLLRPVTGMVNGTSQVYPRTAMPGTPPPPDTLPPELVGKLGGGTSNGPGTFPIPRKRP